MAYHHLALRSFYYSPDVARRDLSVLCRRHLKRLLEYPGEVFRIGIANGIRDILDRHIAVSEQSLGPLHAD